MNRTLLTTIVALAFFGPLCAQTTLPNEQWVRSLHGSTGDLPLQIGQRLRVHDPEINYHLANLTNYTDRYDQRVAEAVVQLRFDESQRDFYPSAWSCEVQYTLTVRDITGAVQVLTGQTLTIDYDPTDPYTDIQAAYQPNAIWASLKVTNVTCTAPNGVPEDVYLDLRLDVDRHYDLAYDETPAFTTWPATVPGDPSHLMVHWNYVEGADSYDLEWLFVDCIDFSFGNPIPCAGNGVGYDFRNATRVNVTGNEYEIPLAYPRGWLLFRARAVGRETAEGAREEGPWNLTQTTPNIGALADYYRYQIGGLQNDMNWTYDASFAEGGLRKEVVSFFDGSLRPRQSKTLLNTEGFGLVDNTVFDNLGRPSLHVLPYPIADQGLTFEPNQLQISGGFYGWQNFDTDVTLANPDPLPSTTPAGAFYSSANSGVGMHGQLAPDAQGLPFSRTQYWNDGTGRVRTEAGPGPDHGMASTHTTRYAYGTPGSQYELDRLFGNEVGFVQHYKKNTVTDANGVTSVTYQDAYGRTIATALAGFPLENDPLLPVDTYVQEDVEQVVTAPIPSMEGPNGEWSVHKTFVLSTPSPVTFTYQLDPADYFECIDRPCKYDLRIRLIDDCGTELDLPGTPNGNNYECIACTGVTTQSFTFPNLPAGTYTIEKVLRLNEADLDAARQSFMDQDPPCLEAPEVPIVPCDADCETTCQSTYTTELDGVLYYTDVNGLPTTTMVDLNDGNFIPAAVTIAEAAIAQCILDCNAPISLPDRCSLMYDMLVEDMSPGGQYFDNEPHEFETPVVLADIDAWLNTTWPQGPSELAVVNSFSSWADVRTNWNPLWAEDFVIHHPEWCKYEYYCETKCTTRLGSPEEVTVTIPFYGDYYNQMYSVPREDQFDLTHPMFNPLTFLQNTINPGQFYQPASSTVEWTDDLLACWVKDCGPNINQALREFLPRDPLDLGEGYFSIWEVIADPNNIAAAHGGTGTGIPTGVYDFFNTLHGMTVGTGLIADQFEPEPGQVTPYEFFRGVYDFYRELFAYTSFQSGDTDCPPYSTDCEPFFESPDNNGQTAEGFLIRYPRNLIFDNWDALMNDPLAFVEQMGTEQGEDICLSSCEQAADQQIAALQACGNGTTTDCYDPADLDCIREALVAVCQLGCSTQSPSGSSLGDGTTAANGTSPCNSTQQFFSFQDVLDFYVDGNATAMVHPAVDATGSAAAQCLCTGLTDFIVAQQYDPANLTTEHKDIIMEELEELRGDNDTWSNTAAQLTTWLGLCSAMDVSAIEAAGFPLAFACPNGDFQEEPCEDAAQALAHYNADMQWLDQLNDLADAYRANLAAACMANIAERETFTMQYTLSEYHYMLYYYDQAGNLVKTVPPAGVNLNLANSYYDDQESDVNENLEFTGSDAIEDFSAAVQAHRESAPDDNMPYIRPWHSMVTWYTYNSFQQPVAQHYPDGGTTRFFYDKLGRVVASQDAVQEPEGNYSYSLYDDLGRPIEGGQLHSPTVLDQEIARGEGDTPVGTWADFVAQLDGKDQVTRTYYTTQLEALDANLTGVSGSFGTPGQRNLRNRVVGVTYLETPSTLTPPVAEYDQATHYSYDIHGNVQSLVQEIRELNAMGQAFKRIDYRYDLISGKVLEVDYQHGQWDQWHHRYHYDADGRLLEARTSADGRIWERDARYFYYAHGPLARTELGDKSVQGTDNYYTLQGWLRGVNSPTLDRTLDPGQDAVYGSTGDVNGFFAEDANAYALGYYPGDFTPVGGNTNMLPTAAGAYATALAPRALYNGNIPTMLTALRDQNGDAVDLHANVYGYDRLNRLKGMEVYQGQAGSSLQNHLDIGAYRNTFIYDPNGNIGYQKRWGQNAEVVDDLKYNYYKTADETFPADSYTNPDQTQPPYAAPPFERTNRLYYAEGQQGAPVFQTEGNYEYDRAGRLTKDVEAGIGLNGIAWTLNDKIRRVTRVEGNTLSDLEFRYGPMGHRTVKVVRPRNGIGVQSNEVEWTSTYYIHDAQGNPMAMYQRNYTAGGGGFIDRFTVEGLPVYGSARLGVHDREVAYEPHFTSTGFTDLHFTDRTYVFMPDPWQEDALASRMLGEKRYELANHLGNVLTTLTDRKIGAESQGGGQLSFYSANIRSYSDYYPFGALMPGRNYSSDAYRFAFQGQEKDDEMNGSVGTNYSYEYRMHDPRIGRFWSTDPLAAKYPHNSPYAFSENRVIDGVELEGLEYIDADEKVGPNDECFSDTYGDLYQNNQVVRDGKTYYDVGRPLYRSADGYMRLDMYSRTDQLITRFTLDGQPWLRTAEQEHGTSEANGASRIVGTYHAVNRSGRPTTAIGRPGAWCASFAGFCLSSNDCNAQRDAGAWSYAHQRLWQRSDQSWSTLTWGQTLDRPAIGAVAVYNGPDGMHVGFAVGFSSNRRNLYLIGGNQGDMVKVSPYPYLGNEGRWTFMYPSNYDVINSDYTLPIWRHLKVNPSGGNESTR